MHWENVYSTKPPEQLSWFRPHFEISRSFIDRSMPRGYSNLTALDISTTAVDVTKERQGAVAKHVEWLVADVTTADLPANAYGIWHDRAVFHFLTTAADRASYVERVRESVKPGGHVIIGKFGRRFRLIDTIRQMQQTPFGSSRQFLYCFCVVE
jgi:SAM-dependent methyltransferase